MLNISDKQKRLAYDVLLTALIFMLMLSLYARGTFQSLDWKLFDELINFHRSTPEHRENVVIVCIDEISLAYFQGRGNDWPWPRDFYAYLTKYLTSCGAKAIVYDAIFSDPDFDNKGLDEEFGNAIRESGRTYLVAAANKDTIPENPHYESFFLPDDTFLKHYKVGSYTYAVFPISVLSEGARGIGLSTEEQEDDGIFRRYILALKIKGKYMPSIGYAVTRTILGENLIRDILFDRTGKSAFMDRDGKLLLNWYGKSGPTDGVFTYYSFHGVIASSIQVENGQTPLIPPEAFKDKVVIVGSNAEGLLDLKATPFSSTDDPYPGMEIHATAIENFLANDFIRRMPPWVVVSLMTAGTVLMFGAFKLLKNLRLFIVTFAVCLVAEIAAAYWLLTENIWMKWIEVFGATTFSFLGLIISGYFSETKDKKILRNTFERYVSDSVLEEIFENPDVVDFKGRDLTATVMATDIQGFTSISEKMTAPQVVSRLNDYLSEVSETLIDNGAFINKYIGDAILAVFGAFGDRNHQRNACLAGLEAMKVIERKIHEAEANNLTPFITRMGVTTGKLSMGNIGSNRKLEFTVIGDTVNSAFRLEGINKYYSTRMLMSEFTKEGAGDSLEFRQIDTLCFKGKATPVRVYEFLGMDGQVSSEKLRQRDRYQDALAFYIEGNFKKALEMFEQLAAGGDAPSHVLKERCEDFLLKSPGPEWDGVWTMFSK